MDDGADLLGVAGGDGTQALVAEVAAGGGLPFVVIPAGTRNHFAMDLGLDRGDSSASLEASRTASAARGSGVRRRAGIRQQRLVRCLCRPGAGPGLSGRQAWHGSAHTSGIPGPPRRPGSGGARRAAHRGRAGCRTGEQQPVPSG
ncbi:diacylglycerol kinase family protein [Streptomyces sp. NPDC047085]|uniref:diacylglycerol kinase family protein n=1 Tax=Streptomyces sp. NPDC047085 TaxID=3155140 RepID=UPI00340A3871